MAKLSVKYHINPETGRPNQCTATVRGCKYSTNGEMPEHYDSKDEARAAYENQNQDKTVKSLKKEKDYILSGQGRIGDDGIPYGQKITKQVPSEDNSPRFIKDDGTVVKAKKKTSVQEIIDNPETQKHYRMASLIQVKAMENAEELKKDIQYRDTLINNSRKIDQWGVRAILERVNSHNEIYGTSKRFNLEDYSIKTPIEGSSGGYSVTYDKEKFENDLNDYIDADVFRKVSESSQKAHRSEKDSKRVRKSLQERLGYAENPRFGVPSGESTLEKWKHRQVRNYSSRPTKDVPILKDAQKYCTKCNEGLELGKDEFGYNRYVHSTENGYCKDRSIPSPSITCRYCGTSDSQMVSFSQKNWSDETSCKRCGGVDGYAIGD